MQAEIRDYLRQERERHLQELKEFVSIPSISSSSAHRDSVKEAADWLAEVMRKAVELFTDEGRFSMAAKTQKGATPIIVLPL